MVSPKTAFVFGLNAAWISSSSASGLTKVKSIPSLRIVTLKRLYVPPYIADELTIWSPACAMLNTA